MTITEYLAKLDAAGKVEAMQNTHIWSNEAAAGYAMGAALMAGFTTEQIKALYLALEDRFKTNTIKQAEWFYIGSKGTYRE